MALEWYNRASRLWPEQSETILFRQWVALIQSNDYNAVVLMPTVQANFPDLEVIDLKGYYTVARGSSMRQIPSGESIVSPYNTSDAIWWGSGRGSLIVSVDRPGLYLVKISTLDGGTPPINMAFGVNGKKMHLFALTRGDNSWTNVEFQVVLNRPLATLDIWFLNDIWIPEKGIFRDVIVRQIEIWRISDAEDR